MSEVASLTVPRATAEAPYLGLRPGARQRLNSALEAWSYWSGLAAVRRRLGSGGGAVVLMYHSVAPDQQQTWLEPRNRVAPAVFERQMEFLARRRHVVSLSSLIDSLERGVDLEPGSVVITFDDGYLDNLEVAGPILQKYQLPATVFLATGYVSRAETQWTDRLYHALAFRTRHELNLHDPQETMAISSHEGASRVYRRLTQRLAASTWEQRRMLLQDIETQLAAPSDPPVFTMNWDQVRQLIKQYPQFELGRHTRDHLDLRAHTGAAAEQDLRGCIADIERETGRRPVHFSFPYGRYSDRMLQMVRNLGFRSAMVGDVAAMVRAGSNPFRVSRLEATDSLTRLAYWSS